MKIIMYPHGGSGNRGCEAIVRATVKILELEKSMLFSSHKEEDYAVGLNKICDVVDERRVITKNKLDYAIAYFKYHFLRKSDSFDLLAFKNIFDSCDNETIALSIGGDNYCYGDANYIYLINNKVRAKGTKTVLWGCSVDKNQLTEKMIDDLRKYDLIVARESLTYEAMKRINENTVLYPDPAFQLDMIEKSLPKGFVEGNTVGINISPMIINNENEDGMAIKNYEKLIEYILDNTTMQIALIPHVIWKINDDRKPIEYLYKKYKDTRRVIKIPADNAETMKGYISKCRFFIGARTHSTIAAYSTFVPTIVVGYSVKARGIALDLFGTEENYVIPVQSLVDESQLKNGFKFLLENEKIIRKNLEKNIPSYRDKLFELKDVMKKI